jgi:chemotaxis protein CheX
MMRVELVNAFILAAGEVLASETGVKVSRGALCLDRDAYVTDGVTVLVSVIGEVWGMALYGMSQDTAKGLLSRMMGQEVTSFDELAQSGVGELGNVITGKATTKLAELGYSADISVPTLILGKGSRISTLDLGRLVIPLETEVGIVRVNLALRDNKGNAPTGPGADYPIAMLGPQA